ncbi:MAG TPA: polysaccharide pyruvyl transferase family protein [Patescibacteria group bacterium]|nr:polysaccharide pyruvyl transferase family protein [Patescibacteria group bacterium]
MNILITHAYTKDNKGDAAILSVLLMQLKSAFPKSQIKISTFDNVADNPTFEGYKNISSFLYLTYVSNHNVILRSIFTAYLFFATLFWALIYRLTHINLSWLLVKQVRAITGEMLSSDLIVPIGGGYIRSKPGLSETINLILVLHPIILAEILRKPIVLYSQSIGPFYNSFQEYIARITLSKVNLIMAREENTRKTLLKIGVKRSLIVRTVDAAFLFKGNKKIELKNLKRSRGQKIVGITVRKWLTAEGQIKFENEIAEFINRLEDYNLLFVFVPQVASVLHRDDDREVAGRIYEKIKNKKKVINLTKNFTHHELISIYSKLDFLVGTRFHSVIFSLISGVVALAIEYEYKTSGIMADLKLSDWVIPMEDVTADRLHLKFLELIRDEAKYSEALKKNLPPYIAKARENTKFLKDTYYEN